MACHPWTVAATPWLDKGGVEAAAFLGGHFSLSDPVLQEEATALASDGHLKSLPRVTQEGVLCGPSAMSWGGPSPKTRKVHKAGKGAGHQCLVINA